MDSDEFDLLDTDDAMAANENKPFSEILKGLFSAETVAISALFRLSDMPAQDHEQFLTAWSKSDPERKAEIARHMADLSEENFSIEFAPLFATFLNDKSEAVRIAALDGLWDTTHVAAIPPVIRLLQGDESDKVRKAAASTLAHVVLLGEWGQISARMRDRAADALIAEYSNEHNPLAVRRASLESLGASSHEAVPDLIRGAYQSGDHELQLSAMFAMGNSADNAWVSTIMSEMNSPYEDMRAEAARAAGELGSSDTLSQLTELVFDSSEEVQLAAVASLGKIGSDRANDLLKQFAQDDELEELHDAIAEALSDTDDVLGGAPFDPFGDDEYEEDEDDWDEFDPDADYISY